VTHLLEGNGIALVRARALAKKVQNALERLYLLDRVEDVTAFLELTEGEEREALLVREEDGQVELAVRVPPLARAEFDVRKDADLDPFCQLIEGVSHFVYVVERATRGREATQLELELQAEIDKYLVLVGALGPDAGSAIRARLYEQVTITGHERYRVANDHASRYTRRLEKDFIERGRIAELHTELRRFYRLGQEEKLRAARAA
jgi:hypothetical protein